MVRLHRIVLTFCLLTAGIAPSPVTGEGAVPGTIDSTLGEYGAPAWVAGRVAVQEGRLRSDLFTEVELRELEASVARPALRTEAGGQLGPDGDSDCAEVLRPRTLDRATLKGRGSVRSLAGVSGRIFRGRIIDAEAGFFYGEAGTLLVAEVELIFRDSVKAPLPPKALVFYPEATIQVGSGVICKRGWRHPVRPAVGSAILVFVEPDLREPPDSILYPGDEGLFFESDEGLSLPRSIGGSVIPAQKPSLGDIEREVELSLNGEG